VNINTQDANDTAIIALSAVVSWMAANLFQIIPAVVAVISIIVMIMRYKADKKKIDAETELLRLQILNIKRKSNNGAD
tara:strand:- start:895 stop:1128 length:234 start_codon:yes stop_codon:yes gene_type:complete